MDATSPSQNSPQTNRKQTAGSRNPHNQTSDWYLSSSDMRSQTLIPLPKADPFPSLEANPKQFLLEKLLDQFYHTSPSEVPFPRPLYHTLSKDFLLLTINKQGTCGKIFLSVGKYFAGFKRAQVNQGNNRIYAAVKHWKASQLPARAQTIQPLGWPSIDARNMMLPVLNKRHICPCLINAHTLDAVFILKILGWIQLLDKPC